MGQAVVDRDLLRAFTLEGSERAFGQLVERYVRLVFGTALRLVSDEQAAQEISQEVFIELARKAAWLSGEVMLGGWLYRTAVFKARQWWRTEERRKRREEIAAEIESTMKVESSSFGAIRQILDEALLSLGHKERDALLLRFVEECTQREVGQRLRITEDAARKRINKGLEQLARFFSRRGFQVSGTAAASVLGRMRETIPQNLPTQILSATLHSGAVLAPGGAGLFLARFLSWSAPRALVCSALLFLSPVVWEGSKIESERARTAELINQLSALLAEKSAEEEEMAKLAEQLGRGSRAIEQLRAEQQHRAALAKTIPSGTDPLLFRWSEESSYVRLPKGMFNHIQLYDSAMGGIEANGRHFSPQLTRQGRISGMTLDALGATASEQEEVRRACVKFAERYADVEGDHMTLTKSRPDQTLGDGNDPTIVIERFADECAPLKRDLREELMAALGRERSDVLWSQCQSVFGEAFNDFGERQRTRILRRYPDQSMAFIEEADEGHMTHGVPFEELPETFKPIVKSWTEKKEEKAP